MLEPVDAVPEETAEPIAEPAAEPAEPAEPSLEPEAGDAAEAQPGGEPGKPAELQSSEVAKYLRSLRADETGGRFSRALEAAYFRDRDFIKAFPTVEEARNARMLLDGVGGLDGIEDLQRAGEFLNSLDEMAARGDPELINQLAGDNPEGFVGLTRAGLDKLRTTNREAYDVVLRPHVVSALAGTNLSFALRSAADILAAGNAQGAYDYLNGILGWLDGLSKEAQAQPQARRGDGFRASATPEAANGNGVAADFSQQLAAAASPSVEKTLRAAIQPYAEQRKLGDGSIARLQGLVLAEVDRQLGADEQYQRTLRTLSRGGNAERAAKFVTSKVEQVASRIAREVVNDLYPGAAPLAANGRASAKAAPAQRATPDKPGRPVLLSRGPRYEEVDWEHDPEKVLYLTHKAYLKDGRYVTWPR